MLAVESWLWGIRCPRQVIGGSCKPCAASASNAAVLCDFCPQVRLGELVASLTIIFSFASLVCFLT